MKFVKIIQFYSILFNRVLIHHPRRPSGAASSTRPWRPRRSSRRGGSAGAKPLRTHRQSLESLEGMCCRPRKRLSTEYFLAKVRLYTAKNGSREASKRKHISKRSTVGLAPCPSHLCPNYLHLQLPPFFVTHPDP